MELSKEEGKEQSRAASVVRNVKEIMSLSLSQHNHWRWDPVQSESKSPVFRRLASAASAHACLHVGRQLRLGFHFRSSLEKLQRFSDDLRLDFSRYQRVILFNGVNVLQSRVNILFSSYSSPICFSNGGGSRMDPRGEKGSSSQGTSKRNMFTGRGWTNFFIAINVLMYIAQVATHGKVLTWGAKVNSLIEKGQLWRLATSSVLHANPMHLMINCYSLNSVGPTAESLGGPKRFLAVYLTSAIASSAMSYWFNKAPSVGASGAIFGLVGSVAVFVIRHKRMVRGGNEDLLQIAQVIALNMTLGLMSRGIDNWGHIGGLLGGAAMAWLLGPAWKYEYTSRNGQRVFVNTAPISILMRWRNERRQL